MAKKNSAGPNAKQDQRVFRHCPKCGDEQEVKPMSVLEGKLKKLWYCLKCNTRMPRTKG